MIMSTIRQGALAVVIAGGLIAGGAQAQVQEPDMQIVDRVDLDAFTGAYQAVEGIRREYLPRAEQTADRGEKTQLLHEAHERMRAAIEAEGLTVEEYSHTSMAVSRDPELKREVITRLENSGS